VSSTPGAISPEPPADALRSAAFREGLRDMMPAVPGVFAWGLVTGVAMVQSGLTLWQALGLSAFAYAGSAQLAALPLLVGGSPVWVVFLTALMVNLRFVIYAAALRKPLGHLPWHRRLWLGYVTGDITFVVFMRRQQQAPDWPVRDSYFLGLALANWAAWHVASIAGILFAARIPLEWGLGLAGTLALVALLIPFCLRRAAAVGVAVAAAVSVLAHAWPLRTGLLAAIACGVAASLVVERFQGRRIGERAA
jgi:predicted branched-subunit amino acid permease